MTTMRSLAAAISVFHLCQLLSQLSPVYSLNHQLHYKLADETQGDAIVGNIAIDSGIPEEIAAEEILNLKYKLWKVPESFQGYFRIDPTSGVLTTERSIDRDAFCPGLMSCRADLVVQITGSSTTALVQLIQVAVEMEDVNDNAARFKDRSVELSISEGARIGTRVDLPQAFDSDSPTYGVGRYELIQFGAPVFELGKVLISDVGEVYLTLVAPLDREMIESYLLQLRVYEMGSKSYADIMNVTVWVNDINDNIPQFKQESYSILIPEDIIIGSTIARIEAFDADSGRNGEINYTLDRRSSEGAAHLFNVNSKSGVITVIGRLDYETKSAYTLLISAADLGPGSIPNFCRVFVKLIDVNDVTPRIFLQALDEQPIDAFTISESMLSGGFIAYLAVHDEDSDIFGIITCALSDSRLVIEQLFNSEHRTQYKLVTASSFDREMQDRVEVTVTCQDGGFPVALTSQANLTIYISDEDDNIPEFTQSTYFASVYENNMIGISLLAVQARDADLGPNALVEYAFVSDCHQLQIDASSGLVTAAMSFNREAASSIHCAIEAVNPSTPEKRNLAKVDIRIDVMDIDDEIPEFLRSRFVFDVKSNFEPGAEVGRIVAYDSDLLPYNLFVYRILDSLENKCDLSECFGINQQTGSIYLSANISLIEDQRFEFTIIAIPLGPDGSESESQRLCMESQKCTTTVVIQVRSNNFPHFPIIVFPNGTDNIVRISPNLAKGDILARVKAIASSERESHLVFSAKLRNNSTSSFIEINENTGELFVTDDVIGLPDDDSFIVDIFVTDLVTEKSTESDLVITVSNALRTTTASIYSNVTILIAIIVGSAVVVAICLVAIVCVSTRANKTRFAQACGNSKSVSGRSLIPIFAYDTVGTGEYYINATTNYAAEDSLRERNGALDETENSLQRKISYSNSSHPNERADMSPDQSTSVCSEEPAGGDIEWAGGRGSDSGHGSNEETGGHTHQAVGGIGGQRLIDHSGPSDATKPAARNGSHPSRVVIPPPKTSSPMTSSLPNCMQRPLSDNIMLSRRCTQLPPSCSLLPLSASETAQAPYDVITPPSGDYSGIYRNSDPKLNVKSDCIGECYDSCSWETCVTSAVYDRAARGVHVGEAELFLDTRQAANSPWIGEFASYV